MKKFISIAIIIFIIITVLVACGVDANVDEPATDTTDATDARQPTSDLGEYRIQIIRQGTPITDAENTVVGQYIRDRFNIVFDFISYAGDIRDRQSIMLAGGDFNEIQYMQRDDIVSAYIGAGALLDLEQFQHLMPDFWQRFETQIPLWRVVGNGTLYKWETHVPLMGETDMSFYDMFVRSDVLEYYGWPTLVSTSEWIEFLKQAVIDFPESSGLPTVGVAVNFGDPWGLAGLSQILYEKSDHYINLGNEGVLFNTLTDRFEGIFDNPDVKDSFRFFNALYRYGLLDLESFTDTTERLEEKAHSGVALSIFYVNWFPQGGIPAYRQYVNMPIQSDAMVARGAGRQIRQETTRDFDSYGITTNARYPERIAELLNWAASDEGQIVLRSGLEGVHWERDATTGRRTFTESRRQSLLENDPNWNLNVGLNEFSPFLAHFNMLADDGQYHDLLVHADYYDQFFLTPRQREAVEMLGWENSMSWWIDNMVPNPTGLMGAVHIDSTTELGRLHQQMTDMRVRWTARLIMASSVDEFYSLYEEAMAEYNMLDHQSVIDEFNRLLDEARAALG